MDFMPTFTELAGVDYPTSYKERKVLPVEGRSFAHVLRGESGNGEERTLFWRIGGGRAVRQDKWKLVTQGVERIQAGIPVPAGHDTWELYDIETDRCELYNLAGRYPERVETMSKLWHRWDAQCLEQANT